MWSMNSNSNTVIHNYGQIEIDVYQNTCGVAQVNLQNTVVHAAQPRKIKYNKMNLHNLNTFLLFYCMAA